MDKISTIKLVGRELSKRKEVFPNLIYKQISVFVSITDFHLLHFMHFFSPLILCHLFQRKLPKTNHNSL